MKKKFKNLGRRFHALTVVGRTKRNNRTFYICVCDCGNRIEIDSGNIKRQLSCGCARDFLQKQKARAKGIAPTPTGVFERRGYVFILMKNHPVADKDGYVPEHRLIVEKRLGRYLKAEEKVFHKNNNPRDNRPENLEIRVSKKLPSPKSVENLVKFSVKILKEYAPELLV